MAKTVPNLETNMLTINFGYSGTLLLSWEEGIQVLNLLNKARFIELKYEDGKSFWHYSDVGKLECKSFSPTEQAQLLLSGDSHE